MRIRHRLLRGGVLGHPLVSACWAFGQYPLVAEQVFKVAVVPLDGVVGPCAFKAATNLVATLAAAEGIFPAQALLFNAGTFGLRADVLAWVGGTMAFAKGMATRGERHGFVVVHGHSGEGFSDVAGRAQRVWRAVWAFRVHIDQAHLHGSQRVLKIAITAVTLIGQPFAL